MSKDVDAAGGTTPRSGPAARARRALALVGATRAAEVERLAQRVAELEVEVSECRRHHHRTAELTDLVQALLVPLATRDEAQLQQVLRDYTESLG